MPNVIVAISGKRGAGKSTLADILIKDYGFKRVSFAAPLKERVKRDFDLSEDQVNGCLKELIDPRYGKTPRDIMIAYGDMFRSIDSEYWVRAAEAQLVDLDAPAVIDDMRYENEAFMLMRRGAYMVRLNRLQEDNVYKGLIDKPSECALDQFRSFDLRISGEENRTPQQLSDVAERIANACNLHRHINLKVLRSDNAGDFSDDTIDIDGVGC